MKQSMGTPIRARCWPHWGCSLQVLHFWRSRCVEWPLPDPRRTVFDKLPPTTHTYTYQLGNLYERGSYGMRLLNVCSLLLILALTVSSTLDLPVSASSTPTLASQLKALQKQLGSLQLTVGRLQRAHGASNTRGPAGATGLTGLQGPPGIQGVTGVSGSPGTAGSLGPAGPIGTTGIFRHDWAGWPGWTARQRWPRWPSRACWTTR